MAEKGDVEVGERFVKGEAFFITGVDVLHDGQPFEQHCAGLRAALDLGHGVLAIRMHGSCEKHLGVAAAEGDHVVVGNVKVCVDGIELALARVDRVEGEYRGGIQIIGLVQDVDEQSLDVALGFFVFADDAEAPAHEAEWEALQDAR